MIAVSTLEQEYKFKVTQEKVSGITLEKIVFEDGREYVLTHPTFMELHDIITGGGNIEHNIFLHGLRKLKPKNEKSPVIDEAYLEEHRNEGILLWSQLVRGLLLR